MSKRAVLLANLGSPDAPEVPAVRRYLNQFLMDPYVIQLPWLLRRLIVALFVLPLRPARSAAAYRSIWWPEGSPLVVLSERLRQQLQRHLATPVAMAMRYGNPGIESALLALGRDAAISEVLFIPLYPHYADSTVTTSVAEARRVIRKHGLALRLSVLPPFYEHPDYIQALVASLAPYLGPEADAGPYDHVLFSYHGLPESHLRTADPTGSHCLRSADCCEQPSPAHASCYRHQVLQTTARCVARLGLAPDRYSIAFQSRLGRAKWLEPSTEQTLVALAERGVRRLLVLCPAFVTDCLETLEEIGIAGRETFLAAGGELLDLAPCLNDHPAWVEALAKWCRGAPGSPVPFEQISTPRA